MKTLWTILGVILSPALWAQTDCVDTPFFNRMPKFSLYACTESYMEYEVTVGNGQTKTLEGTVSHYEYYVEEGVEKNPSLFQVLKNYENAILAKQGKKVYFTAKYNDHGFVGATYTLSLDGVNYWITLNQFNGTESSCFNYHLDIIKVEDMSQEVTANVLFEKVNAGESLALYINFETGKSKLAAGTEKIIEELYALLHQNPELNLLVEGHTDNVGTAAANKTLSAQRAAAVKAELVRRGIKAERLKTAGLGQERPISENQTPEGRALNRRVEIRKF
jgi:OOP family OmpA-OmpF porin